VFGVWNDSEMTVCYELATCTMVTFGLVSATLVIALIILIKIVVLLEHIQLYTDRFNFLKICILPIFITKVDVSNLYERNNRLGKGPKKRSQRTG
jgi:hypothetical protein